MTEKERLKICNNCLYHKMDMNNNVVCNITRRIPDFDVPCRDYTPAQTPTFGKLKARMLYYNAVISLKILRKTKQEVTLKLMQKGVTQYEASYVVAQISGEDVNPEFKAQRRKEAVKNLYGPEDCGRHRRFHLYIHL